MLDKMEFGGAVFIDGKKYSDNDHKDDLEFRKISFSMKYHFTDVFGFFLRENFVRKPDVSEIFFYYNFNNNTTLKVGHIIADFLTSQTKGLNSASFVRLNLANKLPKLRCAMTGFSLSSNYDTFGFAIGIYDNTEVHVQFDKNRRDFIKRDSDPISLLFRIYKTVYRTDEKAVQIGFSDVLKHFDGGDNKSYNMLLHSSELMIQKNAFALETNYTLQIFDYGEKTKINRTMDIETTFVLTGEKKRYNNGSIGAIDVKNKVSNGGFGAFELGLKYGRKEVKTTKNKENNVYIAALNWIPENNLKILFNVGRLEKEVEHKKTKSCVYEAMVKIFF
jgi:hypothetical protein